MAGIHCYIAPEERTAITHFLGRIKGFSNMPQQELVDLASYVVMMRYNPGDHLVRRGEIGDTLFVIYTGQVRVPIVSLDGNTQNMVTLGASEVFGEIAMLTGGPRTTHVIAVTEVTVLVLTRATLEPLLYEYPPLANFLTELLAARINTEKALQIVGKYRLMKIIGEGSTSKVYEGVHMNLSRTVAIKMLSHSLVYDRRFLHRFLQEARTIGSLSHPNIIQAYDTEEYFGTHFIVMEKLTGPTLAVHMREKKILQIDEVRKILHQIASALAYAHAHGVIHRDIKPSNCAIDEHNYTKIMDFGLAQSVFTQGHKMEVEGSPAYLAPETIQRRQCDGRADIYALGVMAFQMVTGQLPFQATQVDDMLHQHVETPPPPVEHLAPDLPTDLIEFINGALIKNENQRLVDWERIIDLIGSSAPIAMISTASHVHETVVLMYPRHKIIEVETNFGQLASIDGLHLKRFSKFGPPTAKTVPPAPSVMTEAFEATFLASEENEDTGRTIVSEDRRKTPRRRVIDKVI